MTGPDAKTRAERYAAAIEGVNVAMDAEREQAIPAFEPENDEDISF